MYFSYNSATCVPPRGFTFSAQGLVGSQTGWGWKGPQRSPKFQPQMMMAVCAMVSGSPLLICKSFLGLQEVLLTFAAGKSPQVSPKSHKLLQSLVTILYEQPWQTQSCGVTNVSPVPSEVPPALTHCQIQGKTFFTQTKLRNIWVTCLKKILE